MNKVFFLEEITIKQDELQTKKSIISDRLFCG